MAGMSYPPVAFFYPNLSSPLPIEICGLRLNATHDLNALCYENRTFLDFALWKYLKEGNSQLEEVVAPHPPCKRVHGTKAEPKSVVVGMLKNTVKATLLNVTKDSKGKIVGGAGGTPEIQLKNVLLVDNFPVPMHIGTKPERELCQAVSDCYHLIMKQAKGKQLNMTREQFPERYREHPYWTSDVMIMPPVMDRE